VIPLSLGTIAQIVGAQIVGAQIVGAELTGAQPAAATPGQDADPATLVTGPVIIDSRDAAPGALFAALPGTRVDGHDFAPQAVAAGAAAVSPALGASADVADVIIDRYQKAETREQAAA